MGTLAQDLHFCFRTLLKRPGFTFVAVVTLALAFGATSAIFSVVDRVLLRPFSYENPDQLVRIWNQGRLPKTWLSVSEYFDYRDQATAFEDIVAFRILNVNLTGGDQPERIRVGVATANLFPLLGVDATLGRTFASGEEKPGDSEAVALSHGLWQRRFGSDTSILGGTVTINDVAHTVVGVLPPGFQFPEPGIDMWLRLDIDRANMPHRGFRNVLVVARLKQGIALEQAQAEVESLFRGFTHDYPMYYEALSGVGVFSLYEEVVGDLRPRILLVFAAVSLVLLIACTNLANLLLARGEDRQNECTIRRALGASRGRLVRLFLTECLVLAFLGAALGLPLVWWIGKAFMVLDPGNIPRFEGIAIDGRVIGFTLGLSLFTVVLFGLVPALKYSKPHISMKEAVGRPLRASGKHLLRRLLVISEIGVAVLVLILAALVVRSFGRLLQVNTGFDPQRILTMNLSLPRTQFPEPHQVTGFFQQLIERIKPLPGVESVATISVLPLSGTEGSMGLEIERGRGERVSADLRVVTPEYFAAMGVPALKGRTFTRQDHEGVPGVIVVSESMARRFWAQANPLDKRVRAWNTDQPWLSVVGVVGDVKHDRLDAEPRPTMYLPHLQAPTHAPWAVRYASLVVRTSTDPLTASGTVREEIRAMDKNLPVSDIRSMEQLVSRSVSQPRFAMVLLVAFAGLALILSVVGIYGVLSYSVSRRVQEIGLRMALGAQRRHLLGLVVGEGMLLVLLGLATGLAGSVAISRLISSLLFEVSATDPVIFTVVSASLAAVALLACYVPARRAANLDPMVALRYE